MSSQHGGRVPSTCDRGPGEATALKSYTVTRTLSSWSPGPQVARSAQLGPSSGLSPRWPWWYHPVAHFLTRLARLLTGTQRLICRMVLSVSELSWAPGLPACLLPRPKWTLAGLRGLFCVLGGVLQPGGVQREGHAFQLWLPDLRYVPGLPGLGFLVCQMGIKEEPPPLA